jgi:ABC-type transporter Mla subunit MlaD
MSANANYFKIGVFIFSALIIAIIAIVVLSKGQWFKHVFYLETYFDESVQGLAVGSPIKHRGVQLGTVDVIEFVRDVYGPELSKEDLLRYGRYVLVRGSVTDVAPHLTAEEEEVTRGGMINAGLRVRLASQGITGLVYLEADYLDPKEYPALDVPWKPRTPYVPSAPSTVSVLGAALQNIARDLEKADIHSVTRDVDRLVLEMTNSVKEANIHVLSSQTGQVLSEFQGVAQQVRRLLESREFKTIMSDTARTVEGTKDLVVELSQAAKQLKIASDRFPETSSRLERSVRQIDMLLAKKSPDIEQTIDSLRVMADNFRELSENAKRYPADVILGGPPPRAGSTKR